MLSLTGGRFLKVLKIPGVKKFFNTLSTKYIAGKIDRSWEFMEHLPQSIHKWVPKGDGVGIGSKLQFADGVPMTTSNVYKAEKNGVGGIRTQGNDEAPKGSNVSKKPYSNSRPRYGKGQVEQVWKNAKDPITGKVYDPSGVEIIWDKSKSRNGQWDMGHIPGEKYSEVHELYMNGILTKKEFLEWYRDPANYRPELPSTNRGHEYE